MTRSLSIQANTYVPAQVVAATAVTRCSGDVWGGNHWLICYQSVCSEECIVGYSAVSEKTEDFTLSDPSQLNAGCAPISSLGSMRNGNRKWLFYETPFGSS